MDKKNNYQRIEFLSADNQHTYECKPDKAGSDNQNNENEEQEPELFTTSCSSSTPPQEFDVNFESQYIPIFDEDDSPNQDVNQRSSSLASSLSIESNHDYPTSPIILSNSCRLIRCPVCEKPMRTFYCARCIQKGHFVTVDTLMADKFTETKIELSNEQPPLELEANNYSEDERKEELLKARLRTLTRKTEALKSLCEDRKLKLAQTKDLLAESRRQLAIDRKSNRSKEGKIELIKRFITSRKASVKKRCDAESELLEELKQHANRRMFQLTNDIFTIEEVNLLDQQNNSFVNMETSPLLTFSDGSYHQIEQQTAFAIVEPWLPSNGDYSAYSLWVNDNQELIPASMSDLSERNPAFRIGAGLAYTTHLVKNLASYLDVILPARLDHDIFSKKLLDDTQFSYNVAKLNANVIHLCVSQGVDISLLHPQRTLKNLMLLFNFNVSNIGRKPILELVDNEQAAKKIEEQLASDLSLIQEDFYDLSKFADQDDDVSDSEWEISGTINPMEMQLATEQSIQQNSYISRLPSLRLLTSFWGS